MSGEVTDAERRERYRQVGAQLDELLLGIGHDEVAAMSTFVALLHTSLEKASWTGFYRLVSPGLLRIGPYQGPIGCLEIEVGKGVCGVAARDRETQLVPDVHAFPGHIACDPASRSEVVIPVLGGDGRLVAVLDLDSHLPAAFDELDAEELERLVERLVGRLDGRFAPASAFPAVT